MSSQARIDGLKHIGQGKVRDIYAINDEQLLLVASDRISAFDVVMTEPIPNKGQVLTQLAAFWFKKTSHIIQNHLVSADDEDIQVAVFVVFLNAGFRCRYQFMHAEEGGGRKKLLQSLFRGQWHLLRHDPQW
jgi:hypothetical protein